jgi:hypothetical protein
MISVKVEYYFVEMSNYLDLVLQISLVVYELYFY